MRKTTLQRINKAVSALTALTFVLSTFGIALGTFAPSAFAVAATAPTTNAATSVTTSDATLNGTNGTSDASGHSFWVSTSTFSTASPIVPAGTYSTPDLGAIASSTAFSAALSSISGILPITPGTTYYFAAWTNVGGTWSPGAVLSFTTASATPACSGSSTFDSFSTGNVNGQGGWSSTGAYDQAVVDNTYGYSTFGCKTLRVSNAVTTGAFGDQTFSPSNTNESGETAAVSGGMSGGTRQNHFEAQFDLASVMPTQQSGLALSVSPDRGDGSRMSYLRFVDQTDGIHVYFDDVTDVGPVGTAATYNESDIATLNRTAPHTIKFSMDFVDGPSNDIVKIYIDGTLVKTGTSWENYFRYDPEQTPSGNKVPTVDSLLFRAGGTAAPSTSGMGFLIDNVSLSASTVAPVSTTAPTTLPATGITSSNATLNGMNGTSDASGHSFWVSTSTFSTASPTLPTGVFSTPDLGALASSTASSALLSSASGLPSVTPNTTYYFAAWSFVGGTWYPGAVLHFTTSETPTPTTPVVTAISPSTGTISGGDTVTITGTGFTGATAVHFGGVAATGITVVNDTSITALSPATSTTGTVDVTVTNPLGTSAIGEADQFTYALTGVVTSGPGVLAVTSITPVQTTATSDNTFANGWSYLFNVTVPTNEPNLSMEFANWLSGANTLAVANNMQISSAQASSTAPVVLTAANVYSSPALHMIGDLSTSTPGYQVQVLVQVKIPAGTANGSYTTSYGVQTQP